MPIEADIVVIGSGIAGAMAAWSLARTGRKVVVLEAGPRIDRGEIVAAVRAATRRDHVAGYPNSSFAPRPDWGARATAPYIRHVGPAAPAFDYLRVVGGTTWMWTGGADRMLPKDFRLASSYGVGRDWPFAYDDLEAFYLAAEREMGVAGASGEAPSPRSDGFPLPAVPQSHLDRLLAPRLASLGIAIAPRPAARNTVAFDGRSQCQGFGTCTPICPTGAQYAAIVHLDKAEKLGARVVENCRVDALEADGAGRIVAARVSRPDGTTDIARGSTFVLAANAIESVRILLASAGETYPRGLANSSGAVGRHLMIHSGFSARFETPYPLYANRGPRFTSFIGQYRDGAFRSERSGFIMSIYNHIDLFDLAADVLREGLAPPALDAEIRRRATHTAGLGAVFEQPPDAESRVSIDPHDRDVTGQPRIVVRSTLSEHERRGMDWCRTLMGDMFRALGATRTSFSDVFSAHHMMGTLRMGGVPDSSVTDAHGRCHDHANLFVAGGAVFPSFGPESPSLTIAATSLRTAAEIARS